MTLCCSSVLQLLEIVSKSGMDLELVLDSVVVTLHFTMGHNVSVQVMEYTVKPVGLFCSD